MTYSSRSVGTVKAAGQRDPAEWLLHVIIPKVRRYARHHGTQREDGLYYIEASMSDLMVAQFGVGGSRVRVMNILKRLRIINLKRRAQAGMVARHLGDRSSIWAVDVSREISVELINDAILAVAIQTQEDRHARNQRRRREERLAGDYPTETTGTRLERHHEHTDVLDHSHGDHQGPHTHVERDGDPCWVEVQVEERWHTHRATRAEDANGARTQVVTEERHGASREARAAVISTRVEDERYRDLLDIINDLKARLLRRDSQIERQEETIHELTADNQRLEDENRRLRETDDPSVAEADEVIQRYKKGEL